MKRIIVFFSFTFLAVLTFGINVANADTIDDYFEARVIKVLNERTVVRDDGSERVQQDLELVGLSGDWQDKTFQFYGISDLDVIGSGVFSVGDKVVADHSISADGEDIFYIVDYVRRKEIYILAFIFSLLVILIGRFKGLRSLFGLVGSFLVIVYFIVPQILAGFDPLLISIIGSFFILLLIVYFTEGINRKSHLAILGILSSFLITAVLAYLFTTWCRLSGAIQDEAAYLISFGKTAINFQGLLLAGILLGSLGILDDIVIGQIEAVYQIKRANPKLSVWEVFNRSFSVGNSHLGAVVNTLFLAYAGASLPLLLLFGLNSGQTFLGIVNSEIVATEIVRTLVGGIGLALAVPISTLLASFLIRLKK